MQPYLTEECNAKMSLEAKIFIELSGVAAEVQKLKDKYAITCSPTGKEDYAIVSEQLRVSDILDANHHQYVDLVQKGGGVWGVALIGFTYVMEELGIRFLRMAGTSAGAINTVLMTAIGNKDEKKSVHILNHLMKQNLFDFVDGHPVVRTFLNGMLRVSSTKKSWKVWVMAYITAFVVGILGFLVFKQTNTAIAPYFFVLTMVCLTIAVAIIASLLMLWKRFNQASLGLNPGDEFLFWLRNALKQDYYGLSEQEVENEPDVTSQMLMDKAKDIKSLGLRHRGHTDISSLKGDLVVITSELYTENKVELPRMNDLFTRKDGSNSLLGGAEIVRASMAIPFFFESFYIKQIATSKDASYPKVVKAWEEYFKISPPTECRLVDGGMLSNFPLNVFYNPNIPQPRLPTIGIDLYDSTDKSKKKRSDTWSLLTFAFKMFDTARNYYDKDFILKNDVLRKSIARVDMKTFNWLDFGMNDEKKRCMFFIGAMSAIAFFENQEDKGFKWEGYKVEREDAFNKISKQSTSA